MREFRHIALALCIVLFVFAAFTAVAAAANLDEGFEGGSIPGSWTVINNDGDGYQWVADDESAHEGAYVAEVHWNSGGNDDWLITPKLSPDAGSGNHTISFWYRSEDEEYGYLEDFNVKLSTTGTNVADFTVTLDSITDAPCVWTHYTKDLSAYNGEDIYIAVQCVSVNEWYLWVDDFTGPPITVVPKSLNSLTVNQASTGSVGTGSNDNPILRMDFDVTGNTGTLMLNSIEVEPQNTDNADVAANGVKLYRTTTTTFSADNQLGTAQGFSSPANFSSLDYNLPEGMTYVWVTYDVASGATSGNTLDAKILANKVNVNGSTYPAGDQNPAGSREILILDYKEIGTNTGIEVRKVPFYGLWDFGWSKIIYTQSEIGEAITIDKIAFDVSNTPSSYTVLDQRIYMAHTTDSTFANGNKPDPATMTEVYNSSITWDGGGWHEITLDTSFTYNNTDNLLIYYENWDGSYVTGYPKWHYTSKSDRAAYKYADDSFPAVSGTVYYRVPNIRLYYGAAGPSPKTLSSLTGVQASTDCVAPGSTNNSILRLDFEVTGTEGTLNLTEINVTSNNTDDADIAASGVKAYRTSTATFSTEHQFGSAASFASPATITGNYDLPTGTTYLWITYDIASDATLGHTVDAKVLANNVTVNSSTYPASDQCPAGSREIVAFKEIGTGISEEKYVPFYGYYDHGWSKIIYTQSEIGEAVTINKIAFDVSSTPSSYTTDNQRIYMAHTTDNTFADGNKPNPATMTEVYNDSITWNGSGWHEITLDTSFYYDNVDNLLIYYENRDGSGASGYPEWYYTSKTDRAAYRYQDSSFPTDAGTVSDKVPNIRLYAGPKTLSSLTGVQATTNYVTQGSTNNPILRLDFEVTGTTGTLNLTEIKVTSNNTDDADVNASGVKAYRTSTPTFSAEHQFGSAASFASPATITGNYDLPTGTTYLWITYDLASGATLGHIVDAKVLANNVTVDSSTYPASDQNPEGNRTISEPPAGDYTVTNTNDSGDGSLRWAIEQANNNASKDNIVFSVSGTIFLASALPGLADDGIVIDASSQWIPSWPDGAPGITLDGTSAGTSANGIVIYADNCHIRGLFIKNFNKSGVFINTGGYNTIGGTAAGTRNVISGNGGSGVAICGGLDTSYNVVCGNYIGTDESGTFDLGNSGTGVFIDGGEFGDTRESNTIGGTSAGAGNVISGNNEHGIYLRGWNTKYTKIFGNYIGTDNSGTVKVGNSQAGIALASTRQTDIGGTSESARNVISGNGWGIAISNSDSNDIYGNYIGTDAGGIVNMGNTHHGIQIYGGSNYNDVGSDSAGAENVISGNGADGVAICGSGTDLNRVLGNYIGTDKDGATALGNSDDGVSITDKAQDNTIGGTSAGYRNIISGNGYGVHINGVSTTGNTVQGNYIGTDKDGIADLGNTNTGVPISGGAQSNTIGGTTSGAGNIISGNGWGVVLGESGTNINTVSGNMIGLDVNGNVLGNDAHGVYIYEGAQSNTIGGSSEAARNVISGNGNEGVQVGGNGTGTNDNTIQGNYIGTDPTGELNRRNVNNGIYIKSGSNQTQILDNLISGNNNGGIFVNEGQHTIKGNTIGADKDKEMGIANGNGIRLSSDNNTVGGTGSGEGNFIAWNWDGIQIDGNDNNICNNTLCYNDCDGIWLDSSSNNTLTDNTAHSNGDCGIRLESSSGNNISCNWVHHNNETGFNLTAGCTGNIIGNNNIMSNGASANDSWHYNFYNAQENDVTAASNYWGTDNETLIAESIYDWNEDSSKGNVTFDRRTGPAPCAPIPELATVVLFSVGLVALAGYLRMTKKKE